MKSIKGCGKGTLKDFFHRNLSLQKCKRPLGNVRLPAAFCLGTSMEPSQERYTASWTFP